MAGLTIILGNKNYSSWSLRPWLVLEAAGATYDEIVIPLDQPGTRAAILAQSPSGRVPCLRHGDVVVWDSLAICEYLNELFPEARLWPERREVRAVARAVSAEMHSGFQALRANLPMKLDASLPGKGRTPEVDADIARIVELWTDCRRRFGAGGPYLFGAWSVADAMYAPVVTRFRTYGVTLEGAAAAYADAAWERPAMQKWVAAARAETHRMKRYE